MLRKQFENNKKNRRKEKRKKMYVSMCVYYDLMS